MLIKGRASPRTSSRVDVPLQNSSRPCRAPPPEEILSFEDEVVFEWSKSIAPEFTESRKVRIRAEEQRKTTESLFPGLFAEVIDDSLSQRPTSGSVSTLGSPLAFSSLYDQRGSVEDVSTRNKSRCESTKLYSGVRTFFPDRCHTAPSSQTVGVDDEKGMNVTQVINMATKHEIQTRERSKSSRLYGEGTKRRPDASQSKSARKVRKPNEERYLTRRYRERPCSRAESYVKEDMLDSTSDLSRECCDVLGPRHCYDCSKITQRNTFVNRSTSSFPSIHMNPKNMSTITLVQRLFPELSQLDILEGVADGYISSRSFSRDRLLELCERKKADARKKELREKWKGVAKRRISAFSIPDKVHFFSNFTDLRAQILKQRGGYTVMKDLVSPVNSLNLIPPPTEIELIIRKEEDRENPANYFCPPLMTREEIQRQRSQPRFYAGAKQEYKLPDAPPLTDILQKSNTAIRDFDPECVVKPKSERTKPGSPRIDALGDSTRKVPNVGTFGGSGGILGKPPGRSKPPRIGRPEMGGGLTRNSLAASSSFTRPLQMETLTEDGSQSEREDLKDEEEEDEEEGGKNEMENGGNPVRGVKRLALNHRMKSHNDTGLNSSRIRELEEEEEEESNDDDGLNEMLIDEAGEVLDDSDDDGDQEEEALGHITHGTSKLQLNSKHWLTKETGQHASPEAENVYQATEENIVEELVEEEDEDNFTVGSSDGFLQSDDELENELYLKL
ncbi:uncharacterized protein LOC105447369 [Strongylocentrotus purpuratus]|uniref:Uncharacterized protein n=1 Tax=Strongylocentrotus purpuratus TaxID=7668 RepID=A0A7M7HQN1_STRPU|nr:uncharacterized protein LOC105447369 [Strongylocentrotus purpuratus]